MDLLFQIKPHALPLEMDHNVLIRTLQLTARREVIHNSQIAHLETARHQILLAGDLFVLFARQQWTHLQHLFAAVHVVSQVLI